MKHIKSTALTKQGTPKLSKIKVGRQANVHGSAVLEEFSRFREFHPAKRFSVNLRTMLIEFLMYEGAIEARYMQDLLYDLQGLFELLEAIQLDEISEQ